MPGTFDATAILLRTWFQLFHDLWPDLLLLRAVTLFGYGLTVWILFRILWESGSLPERAPATVVSFALGSWLALNRGFEVRPELFANLSILVALVLGVGRVRLRGAVLIATLAALLFVPTTFSLRYWPVSFAMFFMLLGVCSHTGRIGLVQLRSIVGLSVAYVALVALTHVLLLDLLPGLEAASKWRESNDRSLGLWDKLVFAIEAPVTFVYFTIWAGTVALIVSIVAASVRRSGVVVALFALAPLLAYAIFFAFFEVTPHRYVRSIGAVALFASIIAARRLEILDIRVGHSRSMILAAVASALVTLSAAAELGTRYPYVLSFIKHMRLPKQEFKDFNAIYAPPSLIAQIAARDNLCQTAELRHVLIDRPEYHPFCGQDLGSIYNAGFTRYPSEVRFAGITQIQGSILVSEGLVSEVSRFGYRCSPLGKYYAQCVRTGPSSILLTPDPIAPKAASSPAAP